jgi:SAM-dependent methyltransferase
MSELIGTERPHLQPTVCAICGDEDNATELWAATFDPTAFNARVFSARRLPDRVHYRMARCNTCGLVRSDPVADQALLADLYKTSTFEYGGEVAAIQATYARALGWLEARSQRCDALLEIGCGNGFFLEHALHRGWHEVRGVEPSADAVAKAPAAVQGMIAQDVMRPGLFTHESFDAVCLFQVLDHISDPIELLEECLRVLRPGGFILALNHNVSAWSARLLGERSPIVDIEHTYLYSPTTMRTLFSKVGFAEARVHTVRNTYSLAYLAQLVPLAPRIKSWSLRRLHANRLGSIHVTVPLGNLCLIARKPV